MTVNENEFDEQDDAHDHEHEHEVEEALEEALELDTQSQIFLEMRRQNLDLLRIAAEVAGFHGPHPALKPGDLKQRAEDDLGHLLRVLRLDRPRGVGRRRRRGGRGAVTVATQTGERAETGGASLETVGWRGDAATGHVRLIDQTRLPTEFVRIDCRDVPTVWEAIKALRVRGAPAIGIAAAYGAVLGGQTALAGGGDAGAVRERHSRGHRPPPDEPADRREPLLGPRPDRAASSTRPATDGPGALLDRILAEAHAIADEDKAMCRAIGRHGAELLAPGQGILTHCNAGGLATADYGTALAVIFTAHEQGKAAPRLRRRDPPASPRGAADGLGTPAPGHARHPHLRQHGRPGDEGRPRSGRRRRRRPDRGQRRHREQDRHLRRRPPRAGPTASRSTSPRRRARSTCRSPTARRSRSNSATRARSPTASAARRPPTASTSTTPPSTSPRPS